MNKTQILTASRAGFGSAITVDIGANKTQAVSNVGIVVSSAVGPVFVIHPFV
jgi:hypothetical protein